ncbi:ABC transporter substrate-binding protein [Natronosporangium hydrolyticum]|uniref:ABC transporter substrate-binding protein n=1 Tax=Natronosporangium hydrolyticum TaxID=2811111 RepID=UPI001EFA1B10|nr:ABC transporter substrate-binding protein [Natronosporangium hydrolyticum]
MASRIGTLQPFAARPLRAGAALSGAAALLLTGCSAAEADGTDGEARVLLENCGIEVAVDGPPERVYAAYQPAIEVAHALGISDRLVQTAFLDSEVLPEYTDAQAAADYVPSLPSRDGLLATEPDFVLSGFNGVFAEDNPNSFGTRGRLAELGIQSWILSPLCPSEDGLADEAIDPATVRVATIYDDLHDLGTLFEVTDRAEEVIAELEARVAAVEERVADAPRPTVAIISPQDDGGFRVAGGIDFGTQIIEHAGGENAFADLTELRNNNIDIEEIIKRDPDVILTSACCDASLTDADAEPDVAKLMENPALAGVTAVAEGNVHPFLFANRSAGVRAAHSIEQVAALLHPELFTEQ